MFRLAIAGLTAVFVVAASSPSFAQAPSRMSDADSNALTDVRINVVKAALQLTADQEKFWPPIEQAIRARAKNREARLARLEERTNDMSPLEVLRGRDPIAFLTRRAEALTQRGADLNQLAKSWQPLYQTLNPDQKRRMAFVTVVVLRGIADRMEDRSFEIFDDE